MLPLDLLSIDETERISNTQATVPALTSHMVLFSSRVPMENNDGDVTLNDLQETLQDVKQHM